jgi:uncharacterized membrane protein HdeD (DUF308 family)
MERNDHNQWEMYLLRGILFVLLGAFALLMPGITFTSLVMLFCAFMLVDGIYFIITGITNRRAKNWGWFLFIGILSVIAGVIAVINPFAAITALVFIFGFWTMISGAATIAIAISLRKRIRGEGWYILAGIIMIIFSFLILINPLAGAITLAMLFGCNALISGIILISMAIRLRSRERHLGHGDYGAIA